MKKIGRYEIVEELGRGAMGVVYKASDPTIGRLVAIKVLSLDTPAADGVPGTRDIFMREARAAGRLSHPGIVTIHDALEDPESRSSYIVMEFIPGRTLESILLTSPRMEIEKSLDIIRQTAEALDYAHSQKIVHRDLKPANILLTEDGRVKITDFGIAKIAAREGALRTVAIMGTPSYMSPEQVRGGEVDARSDLFSMGVLLFLMLTGQKPFSGDTAAVMFKVVYEDPLLPSRLNPALAPGHDYLILRCLVKGPGKRYASARDFLNDLEDLRQGRAPRSQAGFPTSELRVGEQTLITRRPLVAPRETRPPTTMRWKRRTAFAVGGALFAALVVLGVWGLRRQAAPSLPPSSVEPVATEGAHPADIPAQEETGGSKEVVARSAEKDGGASDMKKVPTADPVRPRAPAASAAPKTISDAPPAAQSTPLSTTPPSASESVAETPFPSRPSVPPPAAPAKIITLMCRHELKEGTLTITSGKKVILEADLKGKKKRGFIGIRGGFSGILSRPLTVPADGRLLLVRVRSADGSVDLARTVPAPPDSGSDTLEVVTDEKRLIVNWKAAGKRPAR